MSFHFWKENSETIEGSSRHLEFSFDNHAKKFPPKSPKTFCSNSEKIVHIIFFQEIYLFRQNVPVDT